MSSIDVVIADTLAPTGGGALKVVHIATLVPGEPGCNTVAAGDVFRRGLTDLGYDPLAGVDSRCVIDYSDLPRLVAEMPGSKPALFAVWALPQKTSDLPGAFAAMRQDDMETVALLPDAWFYPRRAEIIGLAQRHRIPAMYTNLGYPALGGLSTYAADLIDMSYRAAAYVDKILRGAKPADIPVQQPTAFDFVINARSAREIGLIVPPSVMLQASQVIE